MVNIQIVFFNMRRCCIIWAHVYVQYNLLFSHSFTNKVKETKVFYFLIIYA